VSLLQHVNWSSLQEAELIACRIRERVTAIRHLRSATSQAAC
jgi:hypothetical protein